MIRPLHRVTIGGTRGVRGPDALELGMVRVIIAIVIAMAVGYGVHMIRMAESLEAVSLASGARIDAIVYYSVHGRWPSPANPDITRTNTQGRFAQRLALGEDGVLTAELTLDPNQPGLATFAATRGEAVHGLLSFRPELLGAEGAQAIVFHCGYAGSIASPTEMGVQNQTTLDRHDLPPFCR